MRICDLPGAQRLVSNPISTLDNELNERGIRFKPQSAFCGMVTRLECGLLPFLI